MPVKSLKSLSNRDYVDNAIIFISDSLRYDSLPGEIRSSGISGKMVAPSTKTLQSVPSFYSGRYPMNHPTWSGEGPVFEEQPELLAGISNKGINAETSWVDLPPDEKPIVSLIGLEVETRSLDELGEPFIYIVHDIGGHSPYGVDIQEQPDDATYWRGKTITELRSRYKEGTIKSKERFMSLVESVREAGLYENTLIIFVSDHGEILGEGLYGNSFGHAAPMCPELVNVPIVFIGAGLPNSVEYEPIISGADIAPTILGAQKRRSREEMDGRDLWNERLDYKRVVMSETKQAAGKIDSLVPWELPTYEAVSYWDRDGGYVVHKNSRLIRFLSCQYNTFLVDSAATVARRNWSISNHLSLIKSYFPRIIKYGHPEFEPS